MLRGIDPLLIPDLLHCLRSAGHGDRICVVDLNFPATSVANKTVLGKPIILAGATTDQAVDAITKVLPLDYFIEKPVSHMAPDQGPLPELAVEGLALVEGAIRANTGETSDAATLFPMHGIKRTEFYGEAKECFAIVQAVGERRPYMNVILQKGVIGPDGKDLKP